MPDIFNLAQNSPLVYLPSTSNSTCHKENSLSSCDFCFASWYYILIVSANDIRIHLPNLEIWKLSSIPSLSLLPIPVCHSILLLLPSKYLPSLLILLRSSLVHTQTSTADFCWWPGEGGIFHTTAKRNF